VIRKVHESPCYPKDIYHDKSLKLAPRTTKHGLRLGVYLGIFRQLKDGRYAWIDFVVKDEKMHTIRGKSMARTN
jgi:hypothetical protein